MRFPVSSLIDRLARIDTRNARYSIKCNLLRRIYPVSLGHPSLETPCKNRKRREQAGRKLPASVISVLHFFSSRVRNAKKNVINRSSDHDPPLSTTRTELRRNEHVHVKRRKSKPSVDVLLSESVTVALTILTRDIPAETLSRSSRRRGEVAFRATVLVDLRGKKLRSVAAQLGAGILDIHGRDNASHRSDIGPRCVPRGLQRRRGIPRASERSRARIGHGDNNGMIYRRVPRDGGLFCFRSKKAPAR